MHQKGFCSDDYISRVVLVALLPFDNLIDFIKTRKTWMVTFILGYANVGDVLLAPVHDILAVL